MQRLGSICTRHVNDRLGRDGPLFRGRFHSRLITTDEHLLATAGRATGAYLGLRTPPPWMRMDKVLSQFGGDRRAFDEFVREERVAGSVSDVTVDDLRSLVEAITLVLAQQGVDDRARAAALAWSDAVASRQTQVCKQLSSVLLHSSSRDGLCQLGSDPS